ncbi:hypothetical protein [Hydrogenophaga sp.]|uniref:hypothetical protein n=1 Tax=Hydrogenophaga sp. TaxID=1904254 RepID=UPI002610579F|nr:hypothetical protein [Hydrogenophaga sp.]MDM7948116.1 hypothetical protein [Hydrogenophaga sp.]
MQNSARSFISIGADLGEPEANALADLKIPLFRLLSEWVNSTHCAAIDEYALVLRFDGRFAQFGEEGLARLRLAKARRYVTVDIQIPEAVWKPMNAEDFKSYLSRQVLLALRACVARLQKEKFIVEEQALFAQVGMATQEYISAK